MGDENLERFEADLFDWAGHYSRLIVSFLVLGTLAGWLTFELTPRDVELGSVVVQTETAIPPRSLGAVGVVLFRTSPVYDYAGDRLGLTPAEQEDFLDEHSELRPVPGGNALIVIGRSRDAEEARSISEVMAAALARAVTLETGTRSLRLFSTPRTIENLGGFSLGVLVALGGAGGLLLGIAAAVLHYRSRRPVLTLGRAMSALGPDAVQLGDRRKMRPFGRRPTRGRLPDTPRNRALLSRLGIVSARSRSMNGAGSGARIEIKAGVPTLRPIKDGRRRPKAATVVAGPGTLERTLRLARLEGSDNLPMTLVWLR